MSIIKLTMNCEHVGCAAKVDAATLEQIVGFWRVDDDIQVKSGLVERDDVGCYDIGNEYLLLHTLDVIAPVVDDAFAFGSIAVSHALSDIYAKGGKPISALSFLGIPLTVLPAMKDIVAGCSAKLKEAGVMMLGGHTISSSEPLVGFAVTGLIKRKSMIPLKGACPGDKIILTKPIGTGIISTAVKFSNIGVEGAEVAEEEIALAILSMQQLNNKASEVMLNHNVHACTDVTGFGLAGHLANMVIASEVGAHIYNHLVPKVPGSTRLFLQSITPARLDENIRYYHHNRVLTADNADVYWPMLFCPETSGGLLIAVESEMSEQLVDMLNIEGNTNSAIIGEIVKDSLCNVFLHK